MKCLLLTVTLFDLLVVLQAQDDLIFLSDDKKVRQGLVYVEGLTAVQCLRTTASTLTLSRECHSPAHGAS